MGSLRNPVGPLPSSIYWRRRAVLLTVLALLALIITWVVTSSEGGGGDDNKPEGAGPATSITPGPSGSGTAISEQPGGRDESEGSSGSGGGSGGGATEGGSGGGSSDGGAGSSQGGAGSAGSGTGSGTGGGSSSDGLPVGSGLPDCTPSAVKLTVRSLKNSYEPGQKPEFELAVTNNSSVTCKIDLGPEKAVLTVTKADDDEEVWASDDCPDGSGSRLFQVTAHATTKHVVEWDRRFSAERCATPPSGSAKAGTYLVEVKAGGLPQARTSFVLEKD
ncbi:hypothetical protein [Streptomyces sp. GC420]|uniref:hypothetical protein n=1 Tax=Streptomyces sp. GC420 TaxID=2697568 RepID=UPI001415032A|nr:hypothetical protein [Streptomyces sp. GC420]NBM17185.1 hypothetical protein [Streptomyces sp. GC420]